jgi:hypothetical protein
MFADTLCKFLEVGLFVAGWRSRCVGIEVWGSWMITCVLEEGECPVHVFLTHSLGMFFERKILLSGRRTKEFDKEIG